VDFLSSVLTTVPLNRRRGAGLFAGFVLLALALGGSVGATQSTASAKISARVTKTSFTSSQAAKVRLIYRFSKPSKSFTYRLASKKGSRWQTVRSVKKKGNFKGVKKKTVKEFFAGKSVRVGSYRLKLSCDTGSKSLRFKVGRPPAKTSRPTISGRARQSRALSSFRGSWKNSPNSYAYQWYRCNRSGAPCSSISGAISNSYVPVRADVGSTIRVAVTASNRYGSAGATSGQTAVTLPRGAVGVVGALINVRKFLTGAKTSQGVAYDGSAYLYVSDNQHIYKFTYPSGTLVGSHRTVKDGTYGNHLGDITVGHDGFLYVIGNNYPALTRAVVKRYSKKLVYQSEVSLDFGSPGAITYRPSDGHYWLGDDRATKVYRYDTSFSRKKTYALQNPGYVETDLWNGIEWIGDMLLLNPHRYTTPATVQEYYFDGVTFYPVGGVPRPFRCTQGMSYDAANGVMLMARRQTDAEAVVVAEVFYEAP
jgi:hypothetical protein